MAFFLRVTATPQLSFKDSQAEACNQLLGHMFAIGVERVTMPAKAFSRGADSMEAIYLRIGVEQPLAW